MTETRCRAAYSSVCAVSLAVRVRSTGRPINRLTVTSAPWIASQRMPLPARSALVPSRSRIRAAGSFASASLKRLRKQTPFLDGRHQILKRLALEQQRIVEQEVLDRQAAEFDGEGVRCCECLRLLTAVQIRVILVEAHGFRRRVLFGGSVCQSWRSVSRRSAIWVMRWSQSVVAH